MRYCGFLITNTPNGFLASRRYVSEFSPGASLGPEAELEGIKAKIDAFYKEMPEGKQ